MKRVIQIFVATLIIAVVGQSCLQAFDPESIRSVTNLVLQYQSVQQQALQLENQANSGYVLQQRQIDQLHAYKQFLAEFSNSLLGGSIGTITNNTSYYYVLGKMSFAANGSSAHLQVYVPGVSGVDSSPADWIVIGPGQTVNVNLDLKDLATFGPQGMYGYYGLIIYTQNPQGLTASGVPSLYNMVQQNLSGTSSNSPFGQMAPNYKNIYNLAGGNLNIDFGGAANEFCISRTTDLLQRNHCITPNGLLQGFTQKMVMGSQYGSVNPIFSNVNGAYSSVSGKYQNMTTYWPLVWQVNLEINPISTTQIAKDGEKSSTTYVMPSISQFIVKGLRPISSATVTKLKSLQYENALLRTVQAYNNYIQNDFVGFGNFNFTQYNNTGSVRVLDSHSVNVPVNQKNSYGRLPVLPTMKKLVNISDALKAKPSGWSNQLWNLALHLWNDISVDFPKAYIPIHKQSN